MASQVVAVSEAFTVVAGAVVFLRLFTRVIVIRNAGFEDLCIAVSMASAIGLTISICEQERNGMGQHISTLTPRVIMDSQKAFWASIWLYNLSLIFTKVSILVQYLRVFPQFAFRVCCYILLGIVASYGTWAFCGSVFICAPIPFFWDKSIKGGTCLNELIVWYLNASMNIATDFAIIILPMLVLRSLKIPIRQKRTLFMIFALGGLVCIISIIRLSSLARIANSKDPTFDNPPAATLSAVESNVAIICACLPSLRPLLSRTFPNFFPATSQLPSGHKEDEEHAKTTGTYSSRTYTTGSVHPPADYSKGIDTPKTSNELELEYAYPEQASVLRTGSRLQGPVRQVHIRNPSRAPSIENLEQRLPSISGNLSTIGSFDLSQQSSHQWLSTNPKRAQRHRPRPLVLHKPLPITPFPVALTEERYELRHTGFHD
ncbi:hypothetical protein GQ43DRAFT_433488 [Delitschia confertaspora ATCC 74209]|uniref:Rhodopsin domain-containing protein n=1 Tax=Delitschia confertaspora ATCC 74209 TaxID=1513339 RepID=A0A9P4MNC5_9PLEO|nr:hypothetical protein GQ43DRAFT_433488 [Delitschia confertaspora ATCC 74209]